LLATQAWKTKAKNRQFGGNTKRRPRLDMGCSAIEGGERKEEE
jgi:hypothetical protein